MTTSDEIHSLLEEARVRAMRAASMPSYEKRNRQAKAIDMLIVQALKVMEAEFNALAFEARELDKQVRDFEAAAAEKGAA